MIFLNIEIKNKKDNILLSRIEVEATVSFNKKATPSTEEVKGALSKELEVEKDLIIIKGIKSSFGKTTAEVLAYQYLSKDDIKNIEPKNKQAEEKAKADAEAAKAPAEEKKEEPKAEEAKPEEKKEEAPKAGAKPKGKKEEAPAEEKPAEEKKE